MTRGKQQGVVRIIAGRWRRSPLAVVDAVGLRPTPDRVRETLFNWLSNEFDRSFEGVSFLDLFAGSGALGLEAASRGAGPVVLVERNPIAAETLRAQVKKFGAESQVAVHQSDAQVIVSQLRRDQARFDVVLLDPPFASEGLAEILGSVAPVCARFLYVEASRALDADQVEPLGLTMRRSARAGAVFYHLLQRTNNEETVDASSDLSRNIRSSDTRS